VVSGRWSVVSGRWSVVGGQWSEGSGQWSVISGQWARIRFWLSAEKILEGFQNNLVQSDLTDHWPLTTGH